ncbi:MAG: cation diffusion facilitator family transporter [Elusimicrobia bacterium]|nr:cation diffusion facilitator family transporter [Elusimicrobiota bacterium]
MNMPVQNAAVIRKVTWLGFFINVFLVIIKGVFGVIAHSQALIADAVHSATDLITDITILLGIKYWLAPADARHPYGHFRLEALISLFIACMILFAGIAIAWGGIYSILSGDTAARPGVWALIVVIVSMVSKELLFHYTLKKGKEQRSEATIANAWHHRSDAMSSIPVVIAIAVAIIFPRFVIADAIGAVAVSVFILYSSLLVFKRALGSIMDECAPKEVCDAINVIVFASRPLVKGANKLRTRRLGPEYCVDMHIQVDKNLTVEEGHNIATDLQNKIIKDVDGVGEVLIHVEPYDGKTEFNLCDKAGTK